MRPDETCERQREKPRPDQTRDSDYAAVRALELPLLRWPHAARHQALRRRPEKPHEREDRQRAQKGAPRRRQAEDREPYAPAEKPRQKRPPLAEARDYTFDQPGLHNNVEYSDDRQRQPGRGRIPAVAKAGVEHEDRITGLRPKRSESAPSTGEKINCISAQTVPNSPKISAARAVSPPRKPSTSFGTTVMKMKTSAAARAFATDFVSATGFK